MQRRFTPLIFLLFTAEIALATESVVALMYHRIGENDYPSTNVRIEQFEQQLDYLADNGFTVWPLPKALEHLNASQPLPDKTVVITFDDAYLSVYTEAFPRLQARGFPFTVFVATDPVDQGYARYMSWEQLRELKAAGVTIANHSAGHEHLVQRETGEDQTIWLARIRESLQQAQKRLEDELGETPMLLAYPYGEYDQQILTLVEQLGYTAFGQQSGAIGYDSDRRQLPRYPINEHYSDPSDFALKVNSLPLPVTDVNPIDPLREDTQPPRMELTLAPGTEGLKALSCYASGQGRMEIEWLSEQPPRFAVQAMQPLLKGRSRYSCTAPTKQRRYQWYSHLWIVPGGTESE